MRASILGTQIARVQLERNTLGGKVRARNGNLTIVARTRFFQRKTDFPLD
jgi:hypothetical protein